MGLEQPSDRKRVGFLKNLSYYFTEFCDNSTIHGLKFLGERRRNIIEKVWWLLFIGLSLYFCINMILTTYKKWLHSPVFVSFATSETPIWRIPFPAITICPLIKTDLKKFNFKAVPATNYTTEEAANLKYISLTCPKVFEMFPELNVTDIIDDNAIKFLIETMPDFNKTMVDCKWCQKTCNILSHSPFTPILTSGAVCYSFNMLNWKDIYTPNVHLDYYDDLLIERQPLSMWTVEDGFPAEDGIETYPRRTLGLGTNGGIEMMLLSAVQDPNYNCGDSLKGFKVMIHHPGEIPSFHQQYFWVPLDQLVTVAISPNMITTSSQLKHYNTEKRNCYFKHEKQLGFFKIYNQQNCALECLTNYTYKNCDCVAFYMPRTNVTPICGPTKLNCLENAETTFNAREAVMQLNKGKNDSKVDKIKSLNGANCDCLPECHSLHYDSESSQLVWDWNNMHILNSIDDDSNNTTYHLSRLRLFFKNSQFMTSERNELYGQTELWANCGGLLGLFTGFSFISFIEILYYATLRLACNIKRYGRYYWSGTQELLELKVSP